MVAPGPVELLVLLFLLAVVVVPIVLLVALTRMKGPTMVPCPNCRRWTVAGANFCHHCGKQLAPRG